MRSATNVNRRHRTFHHQATAFTAEPLESRRLLSASLTTIASFSGANGNESGAGVVLDASGNLFGTTEAGGAHGDGNVFEIAAGSQTITDLADFNGTNGDDPLGGLVLDASGNLFGTTRTGGVDGEGNVFEIAAGSHAITDVADFVGANGTEPAGGLTVDASGNLLGTAVNGGALGDGSVFEVAAGSQTITDLADFSGANGSNPQAGVTVDASGNLFGTTAGGGADNDGTVFEIARGSQTITDLASFNGTNGADPTAGVTLDASGNLFGTTTSGGLDGVGDVFEVAAGSQTITDLADFNGTNGSEPHAGVSLDTSGNLFGTTAGGGANGDGDGTVFEVAAGSHAIADLADFNLANGEDPRADVTLDASGNLFGTTELGGTADEGTVFEITGVASGNGGSSTPIITQSGNQVTATGTSNADTGSVTTSNGNVVVTIDGTTASFALSSITGLNINLGGGDDYLTIGKNAPPVTIGGGTGADTIKANNSGDDIKGGKGADLLIAGGSAETVSGGKGADTLGSGSATGSIFLGGKGADLFCNNAGASNTIDGGTGLNFAAYNLADTFANIFETYNAPAGYVQPSEVPSSLRWASTPTLQPDSVTPALTTLTGGVTLDTLSTGVLKIVGTGGDDSISLSSDGVNLAINIDGNISGFPLLGLPGILLVGGAGDDSLSADSSLTIPLTLRGGAGNDTLTAGGGYAVLVGGAGNDSLTGGSGASLLVPGSRATFTNAPTGNDTLAGGTGSSYADFSHRTDNLTLSNNNQPDSGGAGEATVIESSVKNIFGGTGNDTIVSTTPASFLSAGYGASQITSAGNNTVLTAGPSGAGSDSVTADGASNVLFLMNSHADTYGGTNATDLLQTDSSDV